MSLRTILALATICASIALGLFVFSGTNRSVHAATGSLQEINAPGVDPWGISFDHNGNEWVAQPGCDPNPVCASAVPGSIAQVNRASFSVVQNFAEPSGYSSPLFTAEDSSGNVWFTEPMSNSIGELIPSTNTWHQWSVPTSDAAPFDLAFDSHGNLWFTEILANKIGEFSNGQFYETATPYGDSKPYGITGPDPSTGRMWFAENSTAAARLGSFSPPASGPLTTGNISEYLTVNPGNATTVHMITYDYNGNIWWTEGTNSRIGRLVISQAQANTSDGVTEYPTPCQTDPSSCPNGSHISGIGVDGGNTVWLDDSLADRIYSFNPTTATFSAPFTPATNSHPHDGLAVDSSNNVFVSLEFVNKFGEITQTGVPTPPTGGGGGGSTPTPTITPPVNAPVNTTWYFAEGRVGKGFREYLTIGNPGSTTCTVNISYLYYADGSTTPVVKTVTNVSVSSLSRYTESVNQDLDNYATSTSGYNVASIVTVSNTSSCPGVVAERPMYFTNYHGIDSGTDVAGITHLGTSFTFADLASDATHISYLTILNPPSGSFATVTATYYAGGNSVGTQTITVPAGQRGTIAPSQLPLPSHSFVVVTSTAPVMVERPTYFLDETGNVSGAFDVVGAQNLASNWYFAEGYTGGSTQENLTVANPGTTAATVNITLKSQIGATKTFPITVGAKSQVIWNVNANNNFGGTPEVSAQVQANTNIVVQREMYFTYTHTATGVPTVTARGGTDSLGLTSSGAVPSSYSFAEGYTNTGYNEWLTLQNPNTTDETITVTLTNSSNQRDSFQVVVKANERQTVDITSVVVGAFKPGTSTSANAITMIVQSTGTFIAERPEYYNTSGSSFAVQGGTDIIGYTGN